jgi:hypothetical protein
MLSTPIQFGYDSQVQLKLPANASIVDCIAPQGQALDDVSAAVAATLVEPLDFPPLLSATVPGDKIVLAVDHEVPQAAAVVAGVIHSLVDADTEPSSITVVRSNLDSENEPETLTSHLRPQVRQQVQVVTHDPADRDQLTYIAASGEGNPIYVNRSIGDADLLIPIGCMRPTGSLGYLGMPGGIFPAFADRDTQRRFWAPSCFYSAVQQRRRREEAAEALWLLGSRFTIQLISAGANEVLHVLAGDVDAVAKRGRQLVEQAWTCTFPQRAELVVAAVEGGAEQQTWQNLGRALSAALRIVEDHGAVVLCSALDEAPGASLSRLAGNAPLADLQRDLNRDRTPDALPAAELVRGLRRARVYLLSRLNTDVVESLGMGYVTDTDDIFRLAKRHTSCTYLANAQHAVPVLKEEARGA